MVRVIVEPDVHCQEMPRLDEYPVGKKGRRRSDIKVSRKFRTDDNFYLPYKAKVIVSVTPA